MPLFSVLIPVYNSEDYLEECVCSVLNQTEQNFEVIIINDGSVDSSGEIADELALKDPRIKVIHQENRRQLLTRCRAISEATGEYCVFLDSDDYFEPHLLKTLKHTINQFNYDLIIYNYSRVNDNGEKIKTQGLFADRTEFFETNKRKLYEVVLRTSELNSMCIKAIKRHLLLKDDKDYSAFRHMITAEDLLQSFFSLTFAESIIYLDRSLYNYRYNPSSVTENFCSDKFSSIRTINEMRLKYMEKWGMADEYNIELLYQNSLNSFTSLIMSSLINTTFSQKIELLQEICKDDFFHEAWKHRNIKAFGSFGYIKYMQLYLLSKKKYKLLFIINTLIMNRVTLQIKSFVDKFLQRSTDVNRGVSDG